ncbi:hypothetical protein KKG05_01875 [bacterium]|nr:hypothetical protein [bacterium]
MRKLLIIALALALPVLLFADVSPPDSLWSRIYEGGGDDEYHCVRQTSDSGYIIGGFTESSGAGLEDFWMIKTNSDGFPNFVHTFGGSGPDECFSIQQTSDSGYMLAGYTYSFSGQSSYSDFWLLKTNADGDSLWNKTYGGTNLEGCYSAQQTADSGYILAGYTVSYGAGLADFWLVKTNANGDSLWSHTYGGSQSDWCYSVEQTADGGYILAGETFSFGTGGDFWMVKTNANGDSLWSRAYGGTEWERCRSIQQTSDGGYILAGLTESYGAGSRDFWLVKTDENGDRVWSRTFGGSSMEECFSGQQTEDGGYVLAGRTYSFGAGAYDFWLVKADNEGGLLWSKTFGGSDWDECHSVCQSSDGGYVLAGFTESFGAMARDGWLVKTGAERPYHVTILWDPTPQIPILRWIAPRTCDYNIYITTDMSAGEPPTGWTLEETLYSVPAGFVVWPDPAGIVNYKRYAVTMSCP